MHVDIGVDIELGFRSYLDSLLVPSVNAATTIMKLAKYEHVLKFAISVALRYGSGYNDTAHGSTNASESLKDTTPVTPSALISLYRIPFLLIEDILEGETIANIEKFWIVLENLISIITVPELFSRGECLFLRSVCH